MSDLGELEHLAERLRAIPTLGAAIAKEAERGVLEAARTTAAAGTTPEGQPWAARKKDGARALVNAAAAITVEATGDIVEIILTGVNVYQQRRRRIIPARGLPLPAGIRAAINAAARAVLQRLR